MWGVQLLLPPWKWLSFAPYFIIIDISLFYQHICMGFNFSWLQFKDKTKMLLFNDCRSKKHEEKYFSAGTFILHFELLHTFLNTRCSISPASVASFLTKFVTFPLAFYCWFINSFFAAYILNKRTAEKEFEQKQNVDTSNCWQWSMLRRA